MIDRSDFWNSVDNMTIEQIRDAFVIQNYFTDRWSNLFDLYFNNVAYYEIGGRSGTKEFVGASFDGIEVNNTYNDSCHCHPEYSTNTFTIPWDIVEQYHKDHHQTSQMLSQKKEQLEAEARRKQQEAEQARRQKQAIETEARERQQLAALRQKYDNQT